MTEPCVHRWRLESPHGPFVEGRCGKCFAVRKFPAGEDMPKPWSDAEERSKPLVRRRRARA